MWDEILCDGEPRELQEITLRLRWCFYLTL
jgi:hypothetical protein